MIILKKVLQDAYKLIDTQHYHRLPTEHAKVDKENQYFGNIHRLGLFIHTNFNLHKPRWCNLIVSYPIGELALFDS